MHSDKISKSTEIRVFQTQSTDNVMCKPGRWVQESQQESSSMEVSKKTMQPNYLSRFFYSFPGSTGCLNTTTFDYLTKIMNKPQRVRTSFSEDHLKVLEDCFAETKHPDTNLRQKLARKLGLPTKTVQIWFQNRRAKEKRSGKEQAHPQRIGLNMSEECTIAALSGSENDKASATLSTLMQKEMHQSQCSYATPSVNHIPYHEAKTTTPASIPIKPYCQNHNTVIQEMDSSRRYLNTGSVPLPQDKTEKANEFTIVHIPEIKENSDCRGKNCEKEIEKDINNNLASTQCKSRHKNDQLDLLPTKEIQTFAMDLNLDLVVKTYEVLLSRKDPHKLITQWLDKTEQQQEKNVLICTLEDNLNDFIKYCQSSSTDSS